MSAIGPSTMDRTYLALAADGTCVLGIAKNPARHARRKHLVLVADVPGGREFKDAIINSILPEWWDDSKDCTVRTIWLNLDFQALLGLVRQMEAGPKAFG